MKKLTLTALAALVTTAFLVAATYAYRCPRCGLVQEYTVPGIYKCPNDGQYMSHR